MNSATSQRGVSFIDVLITTAVIGILVAMALPSLEQLRSRQSVQLMAQTVMTDLQQARSEAITRAGTVHFRVSQHSGGSCYLIHTGSSGACRCDDTGQAVCSAAGQLIKQEWLPSSRRLTVRANVSSMSFQAQQGTVTSTGSIDIGTDKGQAIRHVVSIAGRVRSCSPDASFKTMPKCSA
jgi:type IV fimbrial biogenesis protein FimT